MGSAFYDTHNGVSVLPQSRVPYGEQGGSLRKAIENTLCAIDYLSTCLMVLLYAFLPAPNNTLFGTDGNGPYRSTCFSVAGGSAQRETHYQREDYKMCTSLCVSLYKGPLHIDGLVSWFA